MSESIQGIDVKQYAGGIYAPKKVFNPEYIDLKRKNKTVFKEDDTRQEDSFAVSVKPQKDNKYAVIYNAYGRKNTADNQDSEKNIFDRLIGNTGKEELNDKEEKRVEKLKKRDQEVRSHEIAHKSSGRQYAGAVNLEYEIGPDGKKYAVSGHVDIDVSKEENPEETIQKMDVVRQAALAPTKPSREDLRVAAKAEKIKQDAEVELKEKQLKEWQGYNSNPLHYQGIKFNNDVKIDKNSKLNQITFMQKILAMPKQSEDEDNKAVALDISGNERLSMYNPNEEIEKSFIDKVF